MTLLTLALVLSVLPVHVTSHVCQVSGASADCRGHGLTSVPSDLPPFLTSLDLSNNEINQLNRDSFRGLVQLTVLSLRGNKLSGNQSFQNGAVFQPLVALRSLDLGENQLTEVGNHSFSGLRQLQRLLLDHNLLQRLQPCAFCGLASLRHLQLQANQLHSGNESYPRDVFSPLWNLSMIDLSQNSVENSNYPTVAMTSLTRLESLTLDLLPAPLPENLSALRRLTSLALYAFHWTRNVFNETFSSLAEVPLKHLQLTGQDLYFLHRDAFQPVSQHLQQLEVVDLPSLSLPQAIATLHVFRMKNMSVIRLEGLSNAPLEVDTLEKHSINEKSSLILRDLCVKTLNLARNAIVAFDTKSLGLGCLRTTLTYFAFGENYLPLVPEVQAFFYQFKNLEYVDFSTGSAWQCPSYHYRNPSFSMTFDIWVVPKLSYMNTSRCIIKFGKMPGNMTFHNASHLRTVDVSYCGSSPTEYTVRGIENLTLLNVSGNDLSVLNPDILGDHQHLTHLSARDSSIDPEFLMKHGAHIFARIISLEYIDLSENRLRILPRGIFQNLKEVILSMNYFTSIPLEVDAMPRLVRLDLTFNSITFLTSLERERLDARAQSSDRDFRLLLEGNPLSCDCSALDFVIWLSSTSVLLDRGGNYTCITDGGVFSNTAEVGANLNRKWQQCVGSWWLGMSSAWLVVTLMTLALAFLLARFWINIQHIFLRALGFGKPRLTRADYRYDVYVGCSRSNEDIHFTYTTLRHVLESNGFRLYLTDRDSVVGDSHADQLAEAMRESWRSVFVLSPDFLQDEWCDFVAALAMRLVPGRVLLLLLRPVPRADLPPSLLAAIQEQDVFDLSDQQDPHLWQGVLDRLRAD